MDTRFWGPAGWKLFHLVAHTFTYSSEKAILYAAFFDTLPFILPCKFCRSSLTDYYRQHPYMVGNGFIGPTLDLRKWMYTIHDCVNRKLASQGLHPTPSPPFRQVLARYDRLAACPWNKQLMLIWDFLFAVGYHHPTEKHLYAKPIPECPSEAKSCRVADGERNKWNVLPMKQRTMWFKRFWSLLPVVMPQEMSDAWTKAAIQHPPVLQTRASTISWLWKMRCTLDRTFHDPYTAICKRISVHSSDCATQKGVWTCRRRTKKRVAARKTRKNKK